MLAGVERLVDLSGVRTGGSGAGLAAESIFEAVRTADTAALGAMQGHFAAAARDGQTVRLARTIGLPLRYFVAKMFHGPFLIVADRIDKLYEWCRSQKIGWQFDPMYTRMVPAHYLLEIDQIGCPDPAPRCTRFFDPPVATGPDDVDESGAAYVSATYEALESWIQGIPDGEPIGVAFSGGIDSASVLILARHAFRELGRNPDAVRGFTLNLGGGGKDAEQARSVMAELGLSDSLDVFDMPANQYDPEEAIRVI